MMTSPPLEVVLENSAKQVPLVFGACIVIGGAAAWWGNEQGGWVAICLFALAGVVLAYLVYVTQSLLRVGPSKLMLTSEGLVYRVGGKRNVVPPEAIEAVGLVRARKGPAELMLWYDLSRMADVPKNIRRRETAPGQIRLAVVMDERNFFPPERVKEVRELVQAHRLGEWRNRSAAT
ncbi:hypothetical protein E1264_30415 [Actinomadura sp. KC216]|uniref:hypothetical protein n=1 Tax=Actinomadura sp. KC216 TaxID=2530370 RepID=UPI0010475DA8|nr:hypothetical protein [Actinomadura sp. KC216]TDB82950.1 hypothetical protein E1264_30415 [Actinomadura sp. KC216]